MALYGPVRLLDQRDTLRLPAHLVAGRLWIISITAAVNARLNACLRQIGDNLVSKPVSRHSKHKMHAQDDERRSDALTPRPRLAEPHIPCDGNDRWRQFGQR